MVVHSEFRSGRAASATLYPNPVVNLTHALHWPVDDPSFPRLGRDFVPDLSQLKGEKMSKAAWRRLFGVLLAIVLVAAACGGDDDDAAPAEEPTAEESAEATADDGETDKVEA